MHDESLLLETLHCGATKMESQRNCKISIQFVRSFPNTHSFSTTVPPPHPTQPFPRLHLAMFACVILRDAANYRKIPQCLHMLKIRSHFLPSFWFLYFISNEQMYRLPHLHTRLLCIEASASETSHYSNRMHRDFLHLLQLSLVFYVLKIFFMF